MEDPEAPDHREHLHQAVRTAARALLHTVLHMILLNPVQGYPAPARLFLRLFWEIPDLPPTADILLRTWVHIQLQAIQDPATQGQDTQTPAIQGQTPVPHPSEVFWMP